MRQASGAVDVTTGAVVVSWRGAFCAKSDELLREWELSRADIKLLVVKTLEGGVASTEAFGKRTTRERPLRRQRLIPEQNWSHSHAGGTGSARIQPVDDRRLEYPMGIRPNCSNLPAVQVCGD